MLDKTLSKQQAREKIAELVKDSQSALTQAAEYADYYGETFTFAPAYGMGGTYTGKGVDSFINSDDFIASDDFGWMSSSAMC